jgi:alanyl-tRNA synthetase
VVLNQTAFYPEGGGQPCDLGELRGESGAARVLDVQKHGETIVHRLDRNPFRKGERVKGVLDWGRRVSLMRHHTATHILLGAARRVLGSHVWQHGAQKGTERTRLDVTHYQRITEEELREIERLANEIVMRDLPVICRWMDRNEAEAKYGFVLYQGGVVPGAKLRVVEIEGWNTQACAGTHCSRAGEVGPIVIVRTERIQDGVERLEFSAGGAAVKLIQERYKEMTEASQILRCLPEKLPEATLRLFEQWKTSTKELEKLRKKLAELLGSSLLQQARQIGGILLIARKLELGRDDLVKLGEFLIKTEPKSVVVLTYEEEGVGKILVMAGEESLKLGIHCGKIASELSQMAGGRGGGTVELGQGGGLEISRLEEVVRVAEEMIRC